jgi:hypothetical protein
MTDDRSTSQVFLGKEGMAQSKINLPLQQGRAEVRSANAAASTVGGGVSSALPPTEGRCSHGETEGGIWGKSGGKLPCVAFDEGEKTCAS